MRTEEIPIGTPAGLESDLIRIVKAVIDGRPVEQALSTLVCMARQLTGAENGIVIHDEDSPIVRGSIAPEHRPTIAAVGPCDLGAGALPDDLWSVVGAALQSDETAIVSPGVGELEHGEMLPSLAIRSVIGFPFTDSLDRRGSLVLFNTDDELPAEVRAAIESIARTIAVVVDLEDLVEQRSSGSHLVDAHEKLRQITLSLTGVAPDGADSLDPRRIEEALASLGELCRADRTYVFEIDEEAGTTSNTYEWCAAGVPSVIDMLQDVPLDAVPLAMAELRKGGVVSRIVAELPEDSAERALLEDQEIRAVLWIPLFRDGALSGFAGLDDVSGEAVWGKLEASALEQFGAVLALAIDRSHTVSDERRWRSFLDRADFGLAITDARMERGFLANDAMRCVSGLTADEFRREPRALLAHVHPEDRAMVRKEVRAFLRRVGRTDSSDLKASLTVRIAPDHTAPRWVRLDLFAMEIADGHQIGMLVVDITDNRELQAHLTDAIDRIATADRSKKDFLSYVSHELRSPLQSALSFIELARMDLDPDDGTDYLELAERAGFQIVELLDGLVELGRIDGNRVPLKLETVDVGEYARDIAELHSVKARVNGVALGVEVQASTGSVEVRTDRRRLGQILTNLVTNAVKYNRDGGSVSIRVEGHSDCVLIEVADTGAGMTPEQLERLFVPFERHHARRGEIPGTGIGLVVVQRLARALGIHVEAESTPGEGSLFRLRLPLAATAARSGPYRVLVIDDSPNTSEIYAAAFARVPGVEIVTAETIEEGFAAAVKDLPDLLILDRHLPDGDAAEVVPRFLALGGLDRPIEVVFVTADAQPEVRDQVLRDGVTTVLTKPVRLSSLIEFVLERAGSPTTS